MQEVEEALGYVPGNPEIHLFLELAESLTRECEIRDAAILAR
jgi:hypothetical protein